MSGISALSSSTVSSRDELFDILKSAEVRKNGNPAAMPFEGADVNAGGGINLKDSGSAQKIFGFMDTDGDGVVTLAELENALELQRSAVLTRITSTEQGEPEPLAERDHGPDDAEFSAPTSGDALPGRSASDDEAPASEIVAAASAYDAMDTDLDGSVSPEELAAALERLRAAVSGDMLSDSGPAGSGSRNLFTASAGKAYNAATQAFAEEAASAGSFRMTA
jgi:hypothetical protein